MPDTNTVVDQPPKTQPVKGPDGKLYQFPSGTTKDQAIGFFKKKGIGSAPKPSTASQVDLGMSQGILSSFGLQPKDPNRPQDISGKEVASQLYQGLKNQTVKSLKAWGPLAPADMLATGIEGIASGIERGGRDSYQGYKSNDPRLMGQGGAEILGGLGQVFGGAEAAEKLPDKAIGTAQVAKNIPLVLNRAKLSEFENSFVHAKGLDVAKQIKRSANAVDAEIKAHTDALQRAIPKDAIDATQELQDAHKAIDDVVKTPTAYPPAIQQIATFIKQHPLGKWDFETAKQFRSAIGAAQKNASGPMEAALAKVYVGLTDKMASAAKAVKGGEADWNTYNELSRKFHQQSGDLVGDIVQPTAGGLSVAKALLRDPALTKETVKNLSKYGLNPKDVNKFVEQANKILNNKRSFGRSMMRMVYSNPLAFATFAGSHALGANYWQAIPAALAVGLVQSIIRNARDVSDMDPKVISDAEKARAFPGKTPPSAQVPPAAPTATPPVTPPGSAPPQAPPQAPVTPPVVTPPTATPPTSPAVEAVKTAAKEKIKPLSVAEKRALRESVRSSGASGAKQIDPSATPTAKATTETPSVTKVEEGVHGTGQLAQQAKDRIRVAAARAEAAGAMPSSGNITGSGGEIGNVSEAMPSIEIEDHLKSTGKDGQMLYNALQKLRKQQRWDEDTYRGHLIEAATNQIERKMKAGLKAPKETKDEF